MKQLNLKNYSYKILIPLILGLSILIQILKVWIIEHSCPNWKDFVFPLAHSTIIIFILSAINLIFANKLSFKILGLTDVRGKYEGVLTSSYHVDDDVTKPNITMRIELSIHQNLNDIYISGAVMPMEGEEGRTSTFKSVWVKLTPQDDNTFVLEYRYTNQPEKGHAWDKKYNLTTHTGWTNLVFDLETKTLDGYYSTYENNSRGKMKLTRIKK